MRTIKEKGGKLDDKFILVIDKIIKDALIEDCPSEDITTNSIIGEESISTVELICKEEGIVADLKYLKEYLIY